FTVMSLRVAPPKPVGALRVCAVTFQSSRAPVVQPRSAKVAVEPAAAVVVAESATTLKYGASSTRGTQGSWPATRSSLDQAREKKKGPLSRYEPWQTSATSAPMKYHGFARVN